MKYFLHWIPLIFITSTLIARMGGLPRKVINNFSRQTSAASLVVIAELDYLVHGYPELLGVHEHHEFHYLKVFRVLAASSDFVGTEGEVQIPEYILISNNLRGGRPRVSYFRCPSVFFLSPVFSDKGGDWLNSSRVAVSKVIDQHSLDKSMVFELASSANIFPVIGYDAFSEKYPKSAFRDEKFWDKMQVNLMQFWGLSDFTEVEGFVEKALLPFFKQVDTDWFCSRVEELDADSPLRAVAQAFKEERKPAAGGPDYDRRIGLLRRPFTGGEVLNRSNLSGAFQ